jgi:hypothetical protein
MTTETGILYSILIAIGAFIFIISLASFLTLRKNYPAYKLTYDALLSGDYVYNEYLTQNGDIIYFRKPGDNSLTNFNDEILFFENGKGSIKLLGREKYIHNALFTDFELYTHYWQKKIRKVMKEKQNNNIKSI